MSTVNLNRDELFVDDGLDSKVIIRDLADIPGGRALDVSNVTADVIRAGHVIKYNPTTKEYAPLGVTSGAYDSLSGSEEYAGILKKSVLKDKAMAAIMTVGQVNAAACPYPITSIIAAGLGQIKFLYK